MADSNRFRFTKKVLIELEPRGKQYRVRDNKTPHLTLLVTPTGFKGFYWYGRRDGKPTKTKIGDFPAWTIEQARTRCNELNAPAGTHTTTRGLLTFGALFEQYWAEHAILEKAESSRAHDRRQYERFLAGWTERKAAKLTKQDVLKLQSKVANKNGKVSANRLISLVKKVFNHAIDRDRLASNPAFTVKKYTEKARERYLQGDELPRFFQALTDFENQDVADYVRLSLFIGARQSNILAMRWDELDLKAGSRWCPCPL
jgi:hypothetical protein